MTTSPFADMDIPHDPLETLETKAHTSGERALTQPQFESLYQAAHELQPIDDIVTKFTVLLLGRLGMRVGELVHLRESWVDFEDKWITIPPHQPCTKGNDGGICGGCEMHAKQMAEYNDVDIADIRPLYWKPKTAKAARSIPYSFSVRCKRIITEYFDYNGIDDYVGSHSYVRRRLDDALEVSGIDRESVSPHELRATAAMYHADTGMDVYALKSFMGWSRAITAERYMEDSSHRTKRVFEVFHSNE